MKHTPGPWTYDGSNSVTADFEGVGICILEAIPEFWCGDVARHPEGEEYQANAHLIATAPEMYDVLARLVAESLTSAGPLDVTVREAQAVLAKAEGRD
jgi:hypothetical protein